ncbi:ATP-dependent DNA-ligase [Achromobacter sp. RTa]|uniref:DNA ligase D n=1 Tax=Achromobacter sp. RTa TaxID=1532557 RepID=UPI00050DC927|nr:DNA ligase D [Achromobacter sp. RTa]KGD86911.1 ATP-dependent DNA-ligase [Achromobacter sp. RTa]
MSEPLAQYRRKRDFTGTREPPGKAARARASGPLSFVVQRHQARALHYDFRLELDGVLVSWAVPKGPSRDPDVKRLAIKVEDHPVEYGKFEGDIPKGHYGAGHVDIWDSGTWAPDGDPQRGLARGHLRFTLHGGTLKGAWALLRLGKEDNQWLLRKLDDDAVVEGDDAEAGNNAKAAKTTTTAKSGKTVKTVKAAKAARTDKAEGRRAPLPAALEPQLATLVDAPPQGPGWSYEVKYDGYRILCRFQKGRARLVSRSGKDWTERMAALADALSALDLPDGWMDGEVVCLDERGISDFQLLQNALDGRTLDLSFMAFDLPYWNGADLRALPLSERQSRLEAVLAALPEGGPLLMTQRLEVADGTEGRAAWSEACRLSLEGLICKRLDSPYVAGRGTAWLKLKCRPRQEYVIGGYTAPGGSRKHFGALLVGLRKGRKLEYAGRVGTGFSAATLSSLHKKLSALEADASPFDGELPGPGRYGRGAGEVHWVKPELVAEIHYAGLTQDKLLRQASFVGLREDKPASEVSGETAAAPAESGAGPGDKVGKTRITHPGRVIIHDPDTTKLELARYYEAAGGLIMPHLQGRRIALLRCPDGTDATCFFQKHITGKLPGGLERDGEHLLIQSIEGVIALVQRGVIEFHTWGAREPKPGEPDRITIDLDPGPDVPWKAVAEGAQLARGLMEEIGLAPFLKTTGGKGLHLVAPIRPTQPWDTVKGLAHALANELARVIPERFTSNMAKVRRQGRIFVDYLRNGNGATAIAAYSARARAGAPVSLPVGWDALESGQDLRGAACNIRNAVSRARESADPWRGYEAARKTVGPRMLKKMGL